MSSIRQTSFAAGELDPLFWGRTDFGLFRSGLRRLRDFFVNQAGNSVSRPGTRYLGTCADPAVGAWLVPFIVSDAVSYVLEFSWSGTVRAWRSGAVVWTGAAPFNVAGIRAPGPIQYAQSGDLLTIANRGLLWELRRTSDTTFAFSAMSFVPKSPEWVTLPGGARTSLPFIVNTDALLVSATATSPARPWRWYVSAVLRDAQGRTYESQAQECTQVLTGASTFVVYGGSACVGPDRPRTIRRSTTLGTIWAGARVFEVRGYNYYRGVGDYSGFVGHTTTELDFVDDGREPDYTLPHPRETNPLVYQLPSGAVQDQALAVAYFEDRLVLPGTVSRPTTVLASETGNYIGFQRPAVPTADQALEFTIAVRKRETMRGVLSMQRLLLFTDAGVWGVGGDGALTPATLQARLVSEVGSSWTRPLMVGPDALYLRAKGSGVRVVRQSENAQSLFSSANVSVHADHLFRNIATVGSLAADAANGVGPIVDWCWQEDPHNLVWAVRADGKLLSMQWGGETAGFSLCATGAAYGDRFEAVCSVPEGDEDVVYCVVQRSGTYRMERLASRLRKGTVADDCCVDAASAFTVPPGSPTSIATPGVPDGREVWVVAKDNAPCGPLTVVAGQVSFAAAGFVLPTANNGTNVTGWVGLLYQPELELLDVAAGESRNKQKTVTKVAIEVSESKGLFAGQYPDKLTQWKQRRPSDGYGVPSAASEVVEILVQGGWDLGGRATLKQSLPLPVTVLGVTREVDGGG